MIGKETDSTSEYIIVGSPPSCPVQKTGRSDGYELRCDGGETSVYSRDLTSTGILRLKIQDRTKRHRKISKTGAF